MTESLLADNRHAYALYDLNVSALRLGHQVLAGFAELQLAGLDMVESWGMPTSLAGEGRAVIGANIEMSYRLSRDFPKPDFNIESVDIDGEEVTVTFDEVEGTAKPFGRLLHVKRETDHKDPKLYIRAPRSGHYSSLLRDTIRQLAKYNDVYINDWPSAKDVPPEAGDFGLDDDITEAQEHIKAIGNGVNVVAVCQSTVTTLAAVSYMAQTGSEYQPATLTLMGGPLDTRVAPTAVTRFAEEHSKEWFERNMLSRVPAGYAGAGREVYPGFLQLFSFISMNPDRHQKAFHDLYWHMVEGNETDATRIEEFYNEYRATCDLPGKFYIETDDRVFMRQELARGNMQYKGLALDPGAIKNTAVLTVEGGNDDISAPGQTLIAHTWLKGLRPEQQAHYLQPGVGHYGIFNGKQWGREIAPRITAFAREFSNGDYSSITVQGKEITPDRWNGLLPA